MSPFSTSDTAQERAFRRRAFPGATASDWADWRWQLRHRIRSGAGLERMLELSAGERRALAAPEAWRMPLAVTPYLLGLLSREAPGGPLRRTVLPDVREARTGKSERRDPLGEEAHQVSPGLIRSYPHKALLLATADGACFCRFSPRPRPARARGGRPGAATLDSGRALDWLRRHPEVRDVLVSGGDPLVMSEARLERLLRALRAIPHVDLIRIGTKTPAVLPQRITPALARLLRSVRPLWLSLHFTHPSELTPRAAEACGRLLDAGLPLMNQTVLLRGINDDVETMRRLNEGLLRLGVKPYYLHQGDLAAGTGHLRSTVARGRAILHALCGQVSGYAIPHFMFDPPGGGGKRHLFPGGGRGGD
jgi:lysine 2,3-aminomutase